MANHVYPELVRALARAELADLESVTWAAQAVADTAIYNAATEVLGDLSGQLVGDPEVLPSVAVVVGAAGGDEVDLTCDDSNLALTSISSLDDVGALVVFIDTGNPATSTVGAWLDRRADTAPVAFTGTGDDVPFTFPLGYFIRL